MTQNATQAKNSRSFAEQSVFGSSIPSSMVETLAWHFIRNNFFRFDFIEIHRWKGWVILSNMGDICKICEQNGWLFATHSFTNSNCTDCLLAVWHSGFTYWNRRLFLDYWVLEERFGSIRDIRNCKKKAFLSTNSI